MFLIKNKRLKLKSLIDNLEDADVDKAESYLLFLLYKNELLKDNLASVEDESYTADDKVLDDLFEEK